MDKNKIWILISGVLMVAILVLGWFVGVGPLLQAKSFADNQRESVEAQNTATELVIAKLKGDFESIDELRAELVSLRGSLPVDGEVPAFLTQIDTLANESATTVTSLTVSEALEYTAPTTSAAAPSEESESGAEEGDPSAEAEATATVPEGPLTPTVITDSRITGDNFVAIPIAVSVRGDRDGVRSFVDKLQHGTRLFLATQITIAPNDEVPGQYNSSVTGYIYALLSE